MLERAGSRTSSIHSMKNDRKSLVSQQSHLLGTEKVKISFENLRYAVTLKSTKEQIRFGAPPTRELEILKGVTGYCLPGQTTFIMGASGAGKTSLLNLLSDRIGEKPGTSITGNIIVNDRYKLNSQLFANYASYVMQDDVIFAYFTVREALTFAARLKLNCSVEEQDRRVQELIEDLGLSECAETIVGSVLKKTISGGERKRTAIGVELITDPKCVLLDEPTSGLDSFTAVRIVKTLHKLAHKKGKERTVICTIHQPSSDAFTFCDRLLLLADGHLVYQGPGSESGDYFDIKNKCNTANRNPCDFFMRELWINYPKKKADDERISYYLERYNKEQLPVVLREMKEF